MRILRFPFLILSVFVLLALIVISISISAPWAEEQIKKAVHEACDTCEFSMGEAQLSWRGLAIHDVKLSGGEKGAQRIEAKIRVLRILPKILPLFKKEILIRSITVYEPHVVFSEGEKPSPRQKQGGADDLPKIEIEHVAIYDGKFNYIRDVKGTHAVLNIHKIIGKAEFENSVAKARFSAQFGNTGEFDLLVSTPIFEKPLHIDTELNVRDQNLDDLTAFFKPNAGVELKGILVKAHSIAKMRGKKLNATVTAEYKDFSVRVDKMYDRSELQAFFTNLGASLAIAKENEDAKPKDRTKTVDIEREAGESIVHFILRGLKEASLDVAK